MTVIQPLSCFLPNAALFRVAVDGGVNQILASVAKDDYDKYIPDLITGDFDSAQTHILDYYKDRNCPVIETPDQDETDFMKCLRIVVERTRQLQVLQYLVVGSFGGRLDHVLSNINSLFQASQLTQKPIYLIGDGNCACLLSQGETVIHMDTGLEDEFCGLIPIGAACHHVTTDGLRWNLDDQSLAYGQLISTSNTHTGSRVTVHTDGPLLWTMTYIQSDSTAS